MLNSTYQTRFSITNRTIPLLKIPFAKIVRKLSYTGSKLAGSKRKALSWVRGMPQTNLCVYTWNVIDSHSKSPSY